MYEKEDERKLLSLNRRARRELRRKLKVALGLRNTLGDRIIIKDEVLVWQGDKLLFKSKGHIVNQGLIALINWLAIYRISTDAAASYFTPSGGSSIANWGLLNSGYMQVGTGNGVTVSTMTSLVTPDATKPNSQSGATESPSLGVYRVSWISTWNAGALAAIDVSELGLWLFLDKALRAFGAVGTGYAAALFSRLSDSDGDFTTFTVNVAVPLTIEWRLTFTFA